MYDKTAVQKLQSITHLFAYVLNLRLRERFVKVEHYAIDCTTLTILDKYLQQRQRVWQHFYFLNFTRITCHCKSLQSQVILT